MLLIALGSLVIIACEGEDGMDGAIGPQGIQGEQGEQGPPGADGKVPRPIYTTSSSLNNDRFNVTTLLSAVGPEVSFTKQYDESIVEIVLNSSCYAGLFSSDVSGIQFEIRVNGSRGSYGNKAYIPTTNTTDFLSILEIFEDLPTGDYVVQVSARVNGPDGGESVGVILDPGGNGGRIIIKETF
ncbi:MAG: hypothetical protein ACFB0A_10850 [Croceivirga sp.]